MIAILTLGLEHHLASANPDLHVLSGHSPERLLWYYDALAALNVSLALFPYLVILPALVTGVGAFSVHAMGVLKDADSTGMKGGILHLSQLEERAYSILLFLLLAGWLAMFVCVPAPFRGLMLKLGVPDSAVQFSEPDIGTHRGK